ncbi:hypothetical protein K7432_012846 [Basidiobolus ranarum]|uniref:C2H2-type domain-containing protein n=1 Tax=Basidiobolus ranarum TaxID=34480 RepID=A0ABR2WK86_9FUNG
MDLSEILNPSASADLIATKISTLNIQGSTSKATPMDFSVSKPEPLTSHMAKSDEVSTGLVTTVRRFSCTWPECKKTFSRKSLLDRHHCTHTGDRPHVCTVCSRGFIQRSALLVHMRTHTGEKPYHCPHEDCEQSFSDSSALSRHKKSHLGVRSYICEFSGCEKAFTRRTALSKHRSKHLDKTIFIYLPEETVFVKSG